LRLDGRQGSRALLSLLAALIGGGADASDDPGLLLELDRDRFEVVARDRRSGDLGPRIRIALGSPARNTPSGDYPIGRVILNPGWHPSKEAVAAGAEPEPPSTTSPMGAAKIPFAEMGSIALHGGGDPLLLGKAVSGGCVRARDSDLLRIVAWLLAQDALALPEVRPGGEVHRSFRRPIRLRIP